MWDLSEQHRHHHQHKKSLYDDHFSGATYEAGVCAGPGKYAKGALPELKVDGGDDRDNDTIKIKQVLMTIQLFYLYVNSQDCPVPKKFSDTLGEWESRLPKIFW